MGNRAGQGYGVPKPKRRRCPSCGRKGVTQWKVTAYGDLCDCQFCGSSWTRAAWGIEAGARDAALTKLVRLSEDMGLYDAQPIQSERERFEAWYLRDHFNVNTSAASLAWSAWQAAIANAKASP